MSTRRQFLKGSAVVAAGSPFALARYLTTTEPVPLPDVQTGDVITAESWNALVRRLNELSRHA